MQSRNNQLVLCVGLLLAFACAIPLKWYTLKNASVIGGGYSPYDLTVTGLKGTISLLAEAPIWLLLVASIFFTVVLITNTLGVTSIPRPVVAVGLMLPGIDYLWPFFVLDGRFSVGMGPVLAVVATLIALVLLFAQATAPLPRLARPAAAKAGV